MFSFTPGQEAHDTHDGVPRVNLTDSAEDLQGLLAAMYNIAVVDIRQRWILCKKTVKLGQGIMLKNGKRPG